MTLRSEGLARAVWALLVIGLVLVSGTVSAQSAPAQGAQVTYKPEELEALVAPIALYPDSVLSQALMASTYPLEIVLAARWVKANPNVKGDAAVKAVENQPWDVSVKSLVAFPQILEPMNDKLDWTQKLGDAFLASQKDVLDAVQRLRAKAQESGHLKSNEQQTVIVEPATTTTTTIVKIEPANPEVIYVPAYDPVVVYGGWGYPYYPPYYWPPYPAYYPGAAFVSGFAWGVGFAVAGAIFGGCNWGGGNVNININRATNIDRNFNRNRVDAGGRWQHDAGHRKGVAYRDNATREKFGRGTPGADARNNFRGHSLASGDRGGLGNRPSTGGVADRGNLGNRPQTADRPSFDRGAGASATRDRAFQGVGGGTAAQRDFDRGRASAGSSSFNRPSGGGRAGGGARGGGGRGGRR
jgi:uncharacterized membrane protein YgcG